MNVEEGVGHETEEMRWGGDGFGRFLLEVFAKFTPKRI